MSEIRKHPRRGFDVLAAQGGFPPEMLDVVLHHHEFLDGSGYPNGLRGNQISDIVRLITIVDIYAALVEKRAYRMQHTHARHSRSWRRWETSWTSNCSRLSARSRSGIIEAVRASLARHCEELATKQSSWHAPGEDEMLRIRLAMTPRELPL